MIKMIVEVWKLPGMSDEDFRDRWLNEHGDLVKRSADAMGFVRYVQSHKIDSPEIESFAQTRGWKAPPDGVTEIWWRDLESMRNAMASPEGIEASKLLAEDEVKFVDPRKISAFLSVENYIFDYS